MWDILLGSLTILFVCVRRVVMMSLCEVVGRLHETKHDVMWGMCVRMVER